MEEIKKLLQKPWVCYEVQIHNAVDAANKLRKKKTVYLPIIDLFIEEGHLSYLKRCLISAKFDKNSDFYKKSISQCVQNILKAIKENNIEFVATAYLSNESVSGKSVTEILNDGKKIFFSTISLHSNAIFSEEIIETLKSLDYQITEEDYRLLAFAEIRQLSADEATRPFFHQSSSQVDYCHDEDQKRVNYINTLRKLGNLPEVDLELCWKAEQTLIAYNKLIGI
jgi:hypothetical protein